MSNPSTPYGFRAVGLIDGSGPTFGVYRRASINPAAGQKMFYGDVLLPISGGYFAPFTSEVGGGAPVGGVAGPQFTWTSLTARMEIWQNWWTGNTADVPSGGGVDVGVEANSQTVFQVRSAGTSGGPVTASQIGQNANFTLGAGGAGGNTFNGLSSMALDDSTIGTGPSLPFKIFGIVLAPQSDPTSIYNEVFVIFNNLGSP